MGIDEDREVPEGVGTLIETARKSPLFHLTVQR